MASAKERRGGPRRRVHYKVRFWNASVDAAGFVTDVSDAGLFVETRKLPPVGTRLHLEVYLTEEPFIVEGVVARLQQVGNSVTGVRVNGIGVRLLSWTEVTDPNRTSASVRAAHATGSGTGTDPFRYDLRDAKVLAGIFTNELCRGALFVPTKVSLPLGARAHVTLQLPAPHGEFSLVGDVVHKNDNPEGVGLALVDVPKLRTQLTAILGRLND